jgi:DNA modification methylase
MKLLHEDAAVRLHCGDALDTPGDLCADAFLIDPPWARAGGLHTGRQKQSGKLADEEGADQFWTYWFADVAARTTNATKPTGHGFIFCDEDVYPLIRRAFLAKTDWTVTQAIIWDREATGMGSPFRACYEVIAFARGPEFKWAGRRDLRNVIRCRWPYGEHPNHEAEKPVDLLVRLMSEYSDAPEGSLWLDNFMGSATSGVAAATCGRRLWGCEKGADRAAAAVRRYREDTAQMVFVPPVAKPEAPEAIGPLFGGV